MSQQTDMRYSLMAFVGHCGSIDEGHYITCFRSGKFNNHPLHSKVKDDRIWVKYDDEAACYMSWDETTQFFTSKDTEFTPYVMYYAREDGNDLNEEVISTVDAYLSDSGSDDSVENEESDQDDDSDYLEFDFDSESKSCHSSSKRRMKRQRMQERKRNKKMNEGVQSESSLVSAVEERNDSTTEDCVSAQVPQTSDEVRVKIQFIQPPPLIQVYHSEIDFFL